MNKVLAIIAATAVFFGGFTVSGEEKPQETAIVSQEETT